MISSRAISEAIQKSLTKDNGPILLDSLIKYLKKNHLSHLLPNILRYLEKQNKDSKTKDTIHIITSHQVDNELLESIKTRVSAWGGKDFVHSVDEKILSGTIVKGKNKILDASLKTNLNYLKTLLKK